MNVLQTTGIVLMTALTNASFPFGDIAGVPMLGVLLMVLSGVVIVTGTSFLNAAYACPGAQAGVVTGLGATYPTVTLLLGAVVLGERLTLNKLLGIACALCSAYFFAK